MARLVIETPVDVRLLEKGLSAGEALAAFNAANPQSGGIVNFLGKVRGGDGALALELTHYEPLTLAGMENLAAQAMERFALDGLLAWHRVGVMTPGEVIVLVAAAARHRRDAFQAADFMMDHLKSAAWFWKREKRADGWHWIEPREQDHGDLARWSE
ncbi:Molybdenum cofactor biosynthesis protein MoaE [Altererythrobacter epoxidivorans]|uniref:Molybdopterin synthase catalytic subunit n=1 Tax=Altererythrobacter epoxidivorans TaxID=361183 RepID=A0A0M4M6E9_9SPHN|nr:molybdenum cofactor biosynthesis protein MoaE [Altererythrobacter epoxidivorans]ALE15889.1 Molybdenum cofactor biosynthesis protein MoaE [Altererythrobacter epoxidivorans]